MVGILTNEYNVSMAHSEKIVMTTIQKIVPLEMAGLRLDQILAELYAEYSRSKLQAWIKLGKVSVDGVQFKPKQKLEGGELIEVDVEPEVVITSEPENIPLDIVYEDDSMIIVNKPIGLVVHPAIGNWRGTLVNALLNHDHSLETLPRAGIVHRIDKDTSGLLMVAKTLHAHHSLTQQLQERTIHREYLAITRGRMTSGGTVDLPIGRHPTDRKRYVVRESGKEAITHYRVVQRYERHTLIRVKLETGRTHQIRVHMAHIRFPLLGDQVYSGRFQLPPACSEQLETQLRQYKHQALHAAKLGLEHPETDEYCEWEAPMPQDMKLMLEALAANEK